MLKRKHGAGFVDRISDDFSDFSLSSPATKIRRLDVELPPIVEEEDEPLPVPNDERALVVFNPVQHSPSSFSLSLNSNLLSQIKNNQVSWSKQCDSSDYYENLKIGSNDEQDQNDNNDRRLAIVPWVPQTSHTFDDFEDNNNNNNDANMKEFMMEADEMGEAQEEEDEGVMMDVEEEQQNVDSAFNHSTMFNLHHHQVQGFQQHCLLPQIPQNTSTPITWTR